jgi:hypothetical protein
MSLAGLASLLISSNQRWRWADGHVCSPVQQWGGGLYRGNGRQASGVREDGTMGIGLCTLVHRQGGSEGGQDTVCVSVSKIAPGDARVPVGEGGRTLCIPE